jgi:hypothetical protein
MATRNRVIQIASSFKEECNEESKRILRIETFRRKYNLFQYVYHKSFLIKVNLVYLICVRIWKSL